MAKVFKRMLGQKMSGEPLEVVRLGDIAVIGQADHDNEDVQHISCEGVVITEPYDLCEDALSIRSSDGRVSDEYLRCFLRGSQVEIFDLYERGESGRLKDMLFPVIPAEAQRLIVGVFDAVDRGDSFVAETLKDEVTAHSPDAVYRLAFDYIFNGEV